MSFQFFSSSQNGTQASQGIGAEKPRARQEEKQLTLPVTIRMIETAAKEAGDQLEFFGSQPETVLLVAGVETLTRQPNNLDLLVNDGTGRIHVRQYMSGDGTAAQPDDIAVGRYVRMFGQVRTKPEFHFVAQGISPLKSADEVSYHMIEVAHAALRLQRGEPKDLPILATPENPLAAPGASLATSAYTPQKVLAPATVTAPQPTPAPPTAGGAVLCGAALREAIMAFLTKQGEANGDIGVSRSDVNGHFKSSPEAEVNGLLSEMVSDGDAITTIDDDHFCAM